MRNLSLSLPLPLSIPPLSLYLALFQVDLFASEETRSLTFRAGRRLAEEFGIMFFETSAFTGYGIHECMISMARLVCEREMKKERKREGEREREMKKERKRERERKREKTREKHFSVAYKSARTTTWRRR